MIAMEADLHEQMPLTMGARASSMVWSSTESTTSRYSLTRPPPLVRQTHPNPMKPAAASHHFDCSSARPPASILCELPAQHLAHPPVVPACSKDPVRAKRSTLASKQALVKHKWLRLDPEGTTTVLQTGKHALTQRLGVQARSIRLIAPRHPVVVCSM